GGVVGWDYGGSRQLGYYRFRFVAQKLPAANRIDGRIMSDTEEPCPGVLRHASLRPGLERAQHGILHGFFREVEVRGAEKAHEVRHHAPRLMAEQVFDQAPDFRGWGGGIHQAPYNWRTSMVPPY